MTIHDEMIFLREVPPFAELTPTKLELLALMSERIRYAAGETILQQGNTGDAAFVLMKGVIDIWISNGGVSRLVRELHQHALFGEIAVIRDTDRAATVMAKTDVDVLKMSKDVLNKMIEDLPDLGKRIATHIEKAGYTFQ
jgi:CRP-like cAMP-binding protein